MNTQTIFCNDDIITEVWKHIGLNTIKQLSIVSKDYNSHFKNMTDIDYISMKYKESDNLTDFVLKTCKEICKKYNYPTPKLAYTLSLFLNNEVSEMEKNGIGEDIYLIYYWIIILLHIVNNNYKDILSTIKIINYEKTLNKRIIELFLKLMNQSNYKIYGGGYSANKYKLMRHISIYHVILFSKHQFKTNKKYQETVHMKQIELINAIKGFEIIPKKWLYPKRFCLEIIDIIDK